MYSCMSKETALEFYIGTRKALWEYMSGWIQKKFLKLSNSQLNKLNAAVGDQTGVTLRMNLKVFKGNN